MALHVTLDPTVTIDILMAAALVVASVLVVRHGDAFELGRAVERQLAAASKRTATR